MIVPLIFHRPHHQPMNEKDPMVDLNTTAPITLGRILQEKREKKGYSLDYVFQNLKIRQVFLRAMEEDNFDLLPGTVCAPGFIHNYIIFLGLEYHSLNQQFNFSPKKADFIASSQKKSLPDKFFKNTLSKKMLFLGGLGFLITILVVKYCSKDY